MLEIENFAYEARRIVGKTAVVDTEANKILEIAGQVPLGYIVLSHFFLLSFSF